MDDYGGYGEHYWDYAHGPSDYKGDGGKGYYEEPAKYPSPKFDQTPIEYSRPSSYDSGDVPVYKPKVYKSVGYKPKSHYHQGFEGRQDVVDDAAEVSSKQYDSIYRSSPSTKVLTGRIKKN